MPAADAFEAERRRLTGLAYRMLGSVADAEDIVQDAWLRWDRLGPTGPEQVERPPAWLTTTVSRLALDRLKSAQRQRETYVGPWLPEPVLTTGDPADSVELAESLTLGFLVVLERLSPVERAVFLLVDVFGEPFATVAEVVERSEEACRQIAHRARGRVRDDRRHHPPPSAANELVNAFLGACAMGDVTTLRQLLAEEVVLVSDGGARVHAARHPIVGFDRVARFVVNLTKRMPADTRACPSAVNGESGLVTFRGETPWFVMAFEVADDRIVAIRLIINPDKLVRAGSPA